AQRIRRERRVVVLVRLGDGTRLVNLQKVHRNAEVLRGQVGEAVGGGLVADRERVTQVFDRQLLLLLRPAQELDGTHLGNHQRGGQIVGLHTLSQEAGVVGGLLGAEHVAGQ